MSKSIGIKLADGAFYPILEEGKSAQISMDLTTAKDNQESVHIDLYRSESGTLEDAEYVDTLQIENMKPHPNGEPNLRLEISLDDENTLNAKVSDLESGNHSDITVSLVSRPESERTTVDAGTSLQFTEPAADKVFDDTLDLDNLVFDADESQIVDADDIAFDEEMPFESSENLLTGDTAESFDQIADDTFDNAAITAEQPGSELSEDFFDNAVNEFLDDAPLGESNHENFVKNGAEDLTDFSIDFDDLPPPDDLEKSSSDFKIDFDDIPPPPAQNEKNGSALSFYDDDFNIDDVKHELPKDDFSDATQNVLFTDLYDDNDFSEEDRTETQREEKKKSRGGIIALICLLCAVICIAVVLLFLFGIPPGISSRLGGDKKQTIETAAPEDEHPPVPPVDQIIFTDKPITIVPIPAPQGQPSEPAQEQTPAPEQTPPAPEQKAPQEQQPPQEQAPPPPPVQEPPPPPQQQPVETTLTPQPIRYRVKWGDTLWDIAWAYYRNPWRYTYIARYNGIKNPDKIMAGTVILIPPR